VAVLVEAPREIKRDIWEISPLQEAVYNRLARELCSSGDIGRDVVILVPARGDLGGVRVDGRDVCRVCGKVSVVGDKGGLHCEVAFRKGGGWRSGFDKERVWKTGLDMGSSNGLLLHFVRIRVTRTVGGC
jgi:hypothetical protein